MAIPKPSKTHIHIAATLGNFVITWSTFDLILDATIMRQLKINATQAAIVTSGLGFERKLSIARSLLHLHDPKYAEAIKKLDQITTIARRNLLMHGHVHIEKNAIRIVKVEAKNKMTAKSMVLEPDKFGAVVLSINDLLTELQSDLGISDSALTSLANIGKKLTNKSTGSPKPQTN
jgi:hypothetical protein